MDNKAEPIKAAPTAQRQTNFDRKKYLLTDALCELGYDDTLVNTLIKRNIVDFSSVDYTSDIIDQLIEHYGYSKVLIYLEDAVVFEELDIALTGELGRSWQASKGETFRERIQDMIAIPIKSLGLIVIESSALENHKLTRQLDAAKRNLVIDYGEFGMHLPYADIVVYSPENSRVIAVISCGVNLKNRVIDMAYSKLKLQTSEITASIKYYLITTDFAERSIVETDLDGIYIISSKSIKGNHYVKQFEHFIDDFKKVLEESNNL